MGMMGRVLGATGVVRQAGAAVTEVAEVFVGNRAEREAAEHAQRAATVAQYAAEFGGARASRFDGFMNGLNRLPRPLLVIGTLGLFAYAMAAPAGFSVRMQGLALVPEPMWWLLGAIVSFYFGARELHYRRDPAGFSPSQLPASPLIAATQDEAETDAAQPPAALFWRRTEAPAPAAAAPVAVGASDPEFNAAVEDWRLLRT